MNEPEGLIEMGVIGAAHGLKGEVRVKSFAADPLALGRYGSLWTEEGRHLEIAALRPAGAMLVVRFKGIADRTEAEKLNGRKLFIERKSLPAPEDEEEFYHADLVGLLVRDGEGREIGRITAVENYGGGDLLEIVHEGRAGMLIPFSRAAVPQVCVADGFVTVDPLAAGLVEEPDEEDLP